MPRLTRIYTRTGDDGTTALGTGARVPKTSARIAAYGEVDELNSVIGVALAEGLDASVDQVLRPIQNELFHLGSDLCFPEADKARVKIPQIEARHVDALEAAMDRFSEHLAPLENFVLPGGSPGAARLHVARATCRRAERAVVALAAIEPIGAFVVRYLNRLSDLLFVLARVENQQRGVQDVCWNSRA